MTVKKTMQLQSDSPMITHRLASIIGSRLHGGEIIDLRSDLGGGKTAFVKGLAEGLKSPDQVSSPSFTLRNEYRSGNLTIYHFDFYRLSEPGILKAELAELLDDDQAIIVIEWSSIVSDLLPERNLTITIRVTGDQSRRFLLNYPDSLAYLVKGLE